MNNTIIGIILALIVIAGLAWYFELIPQQVTSTATPPASTTTTAPSK